MAASEHLLDPTHMSLRIRYPDYFTPSNDCSHHLSWVTYRRIVDKGVIATVLFAPLDWIMVVDGRAAALKNGLWRRGMLRFLMDVRKWG
jgi:hypothetical protein